MKEAWELFLHGGFVMWPLLVALIIAVAIAIERIAYYQMCIRDRAHIQPAFDNGLWKCVHCMNCISRCPKHLKQMCIRDRSKTIVPNGLSY